MRRTFIFGLVALLGCNAVLGIESASFTSAEAEAGVPDAESDARAVDASIVDAPTPTRDAAPDVVEAGCGDTKSSPRNCGSCGHDCANGACTAGVCQPYTMYLGTQGPLTALAVDDARVYFIESKGVLIQSIEIEDATPSATPVYGDDSNSNMLQNLVVQGSLVYFGTSPGQTIFSCPTTGCASPTTVVTVSGTLNSFALNAAGAVVVATGGPAGAISLCSAPPCTLDQAQAIMSNLPYVSQVAAYGDAIAWTMFGDFTTPHDAATPSGSVNFWSQGTPTTLDQVNGIFSVALTTDHAYYEGNGDLRAIALPPTKSIPVAIGDAPTTTNIVFDGTSIYWSDSTAVMRVGLGAADVPVAFMSPQQGAPLYVAVNATSVVWIDGQNNTIVRVVK